MKKLFGYIGTQVKTITSYIGRSRLAKTLLIIIAVKLFIFYGVLKGFVFPRYLKPKWDSDEQRRDAVIDDLIKKPNTYLYDCIH